MAHGDGPDLAPHEGGPEITSLPNVRRSNRRRKWLQLLLLSLSPWPRPRLSSCISRRSKITSSWPGEVKCESAACLPVPKQTVTFGRTRITGPKGKAQWAGRKLSHPGEKEAVETRTERRFSEGLASRGRNQRLGESRLTPTGHCPYSVTRGVGPGQVPRQGAASRWAT